MLEGDAAVLGTARQVFLICASFTVLLLLGAGFLIIRLRPRKNARVFAQTTWWATVCVLAITEIILLASVLSLYYESAGSFYLLQSVFAVTTGGCAVFGLSYLASVFGMLRDELKRGHAMQEQLQNQRRDLERLVLARTASLRKEILQVQHLRKAVEREHARLDNELRLAAKLQSAVMPQDLSFPGLKVGVQFHPMGQTSGDIYDVFDTDDGAVYFFVADAMGHGTAAALLTMMVSAALRSLDHGPSPAAMLTALNEALLKRNTGLYVTAVLARLTPDGQLTVAHAGHPSMLLLRAGADSPETCREGGFALGMFDAAQMPFVDECLQLERGDRLLFYTDGLIETGTAAGAVFGIEEVSAIIKTATAQGHDITETAAQLMEAVYDHCAGGKLKDDITVIAVEYMPT
jgi:serine phosphatase RsbU (regulator of sigma subunit)